MMFEPTNEQIAEDIEHWYADSEAYHNMCKYYPQHVINHHLAKWVRASKRSMRLTPRHITHLGTWANSPQGHDFWRYIVVRVEEGGESRPEMEELIFNLT